MCVGERLMSLEPERGCQLIGSAIWCLVVCVGERVVAVEPERGCQLIGSAIWCLACHDDVVLAGCHNGSIEV